MYTFDQNKKILLSAAILFTLSFSVMVFFLQRYSGDFDHGQADVLNHGSEEITQESQDPTWLEHLPEDAPAFVIVPDGHFEFVNDSLQRLLGLEDNYSGKLLFDYVDSEDLSLLVTAETELIQGAESRDNIGPIRLYNGKRDIIVFLSAIPVLDDDDHVQYIIFSVYDLTEKIDELRKNEEEAEDNSPENGLKKGNAPTIKEVPEDGHHRFTVEKIGYQSE